MALSTAQPKPMPSPPAQRKLNIYLQLFRIGTGLMALIPFTTGLGGSMKGLCFYRFLAGAIPDAVCTDSGLTNQVQFVSTMWFGYAPMIAVFLSDMGRYAPTMYVMFACAFGGGLIRTTLLALHGIPPKTTSWAYIFVAIFLEVVVIPVLVFLLRKGLAEKNKAE